MIISQVNFDLQKLQCASLGPISMKFWSDADPGPYWKQFVDEKQDLNKNYKV